MFRRARFLSCISLALLATSSVEAKPRESFDARAHAAPARRLSPPSNSTGAVTSWDDTRGTPSFLWADTSKPLSPSVVALSPEGRARHYLAEHAARYGLSPAALQAARRTLLHDTGTGGVVQVFRQAIDGVELMHSDMKVLTDRQGKLVALSGALHPGAAAGSADKWGPFVLDPVDARVLEELRTQQHRSDPLF